MKRLHQLKELQKGDFFGFNFLLLFTLFNTASSASPVSEDAGIEPWTVATLSLAASSNHSARNNFTAFLSVRIIYD
jgi:hypothetical protein